MLFSLVYKNTILLICLFLLKVDLSFEIFFCRIAELVAEMINEEKEIVRSGIWNHAQKTGLRPERSALDRSAILTSDK